MIIPQTTAFKTATARFEIKEESSWSSYFVNKGFICECDTLLDGPGSPEKDASHLSLSPVRGEGCLPTGRQGVRG
jgi:hypothetical protein